MSRINSNSVIKIDPEENKILLVLLPFWTPQIPPMGISCLKSYLQDRGYRVKTADVNVEDVLKDIYNKYFNLLEGCIPGDKRGNFYNIGQEVFQNHMMAHLNAVDETEYGELVKLLVQKTFYTGIENSTVIRLNRVIKEIYEWLQEYLIDLLQKEKPALLGLSVYKGNVPASLFAARLAKEKYPEINTVIGGAAFSQTLSVGTPDFEYFLKRTKPYIDKIIIGEGEKLFYKLLRGELPAENRYYTKQDILEETVSLAELDIPDFSDFDLQAYPHLAAYSSRSCPFQCKFCSETVYWGKYRKKTGQQVVDELEKLYEIHGFQLFLMCDSLLNPVIDKLATTFINSDISLYWDGYIRADKPVCDIENTYLWRKGGFYRARLGVESGSQHVLDLMDKKVPVEQVKAAISSLARVGIKTTTYWLVGYPGETESDFQQTLDLLTELKDDIFEAECNPFGFYLDGQVNSEEWLEKNKGTPLYPGKARKMLLLQTWIMDSEPSRAEIYKRVNRFVEHCGKLGIPNPYSLFDIHKADERWMLLHKNAVPPLNVFKDSKYIDECKYVKKIGHARAISADAVSFDF